jgi:hypothetical protein
MIDATADKKNDMVNIFLDNDVFAIYPQEATELYNKLGLVLEHDFRTIQERK